MADSSEPKVDLDSFVQKLDDIDAELEIQSEYLGKIRILMTLLVLLMIPIALFVIYFFYILINPRPIF